MIFQSGIKCSEKNQKKNFPRVPPLHIFENFLDNLGVYQYVLSLVSMPSPSTTTTITSSKSSKFLKICKGGTLGTFSKIFKNMQRGDPWKKNFLIFFLTLYSTLEDHMRLLECHLRVLECWIPHNQPNVTHSPLCPASSNNIVTRWLW